MAAGELEGGGREERKVLISLQDTQPLLAPLGSSTRIKYTCIAASQRYVALGANTGGVYCFHSDGMRYIRLLSNREGAVSLLRFSPDESVLAVVSGGGSVALWELNLLVDKTSRRFHVSTLLRDSVVQSLTWDSRGTRLFYGDESGRIAVSYMPKFSNKLFKKPDDVVHQEKSPIVQMDFNQEVLLVSTEQRCVLLRLASKELVKIGTKPRDGPFGGCFHYRGPNRPPVIFSARPGGRIWEADGEEGKVGSTLKLKDLIATMPAVPIMGVGFKPDFSSLATQLQRSLSLTQLHILNGRYLLTSLEDTLLLSDSVSYKLAAWSRGDLQAIVEVCCCGGQLYVLCDGGRRVAQLSLLTVEQCLVELVRFGELTQALDLMTAFSGDIVAFLPDSPALLQATRTVVQFAATVEREIPQCIDDVIASSMEITKTKETGQVEKKEEEEEEEEERGEGEEEGGEGGEGEGETEEKGNIVNSWQLASDGGEGSEGDGSLVEIDLRSPSPVPVAPRPLNFDPVAIGNHSLLEGEIPVEELLLQSNFVAMATLPSSNSAVEETDAGLLPLDVVLDDTAGQTGPAPPDTDLLSSQSTGEPEESVSRQSSDGAATSRPPQEEEEKEEKEEEEIGKQQVASVVESREDRLTVSLESYPEMKGVEVPSHELTDPFSQESSGLETSSLTEEAGLSAASRHQEAPRISRSVSLTARAETSERVASVLGKSEDDDVIAVPVRSSSGGLKEDGGKRGRKKTKRRKKLGSSSHLARRSSNPEISTTSSLSSSYPHSFRHIPEETLPFPEAVASLPPSSSPLPPHPHSQLSSAATSTSISPMASLPSSPPEQGQSILELNTTALMSKVEAINDALRIGTQQQEDGGEGGGEGGGGGGGGGEEGEERGGGGEGGRGGGEEREHPVVFTKADSSLSTGGKAKSAQTSLGTREKSKAMQPSLALGEKATEQSQVPNSVALLPRPVSMETESRTRPGDILSKVKKMAKQGGQNIGLEPEVIQRPVKKMKELLSSLTNPTLPPHHPSHSSQPHTTQLVFRNDEAIGVSSRSLIDASQSDAVVAIGNTRSNSQPKATQVVTFQSATMATVSSLSDVLVICSREKLQQTLSNWLSEMDDFHRYLSSLADPLPVEGELPNKATDVTSSNESVFSSPCYLSLGPSLLQSVSELATLCVEVRVFGEGRMMAGFLSTYAPVLDGVRTRAALGLVSEWDQRKGAWLQLAQGIGNEDLTDLEPDAVVEAVCGGEAASHGVKLPAYLTRLRELAPDSMVDYCSSTPQIEPWEVAMVCGIDQSDATTKAPDSQLDQKTSSSPSEVYANYFSMLFEKHSPHCRSRLREAMLRDPHLTSLTLESLVSTGPAQSGDYPSPWSHLSPQHHSSALQWLVTIATALPPPHRKHVLGICKSHRYWLGVVELLVADDDRQEALKILVHLGDMNLIRGEQKWGLLPCGVAELRVMLMEADRLSQSEHPLSGSHPPFSSTDPSSGPNPIPLTWENVLQYLLGELGPPEVASLLGGARGTRLGGATDQWLQSLLIRLSSVHSQQRALAHSLLEKVDRYLWSPRSHNLSPQILWTQTQEKLERNRGRMEWTGDGMEQNGSESRERLSQSSWLSTAVPLSRSLEDASGHWGAQTKTPTGSSSLTCLLCQLPLLITAPELQCGMVMFECGHAYHKPCVPEQACVLCFTHRYREYVGT